MTPVKYVQIYMLEVGNKIFKGSNLIGREVMFNQIYNKNGGVGGLTKYSPPKAEQKEWV